MPDLVIRHRRVEPDGWTVVGLDAGAPCDATLPPGPVLVPLAAWRTRREELLARPVPFGVWLAPDDDPEVLRGDLERFALVAVHFPRFTDGRGYSTATLLRERLGYRGELRAFGDIGRDQVFYLARVGFDAMRLAGDADPERALAAFDDFSVRYQGAVDEQLPLFQRRARASHG